MKHKNCIVTVNLTLIIALSFARDNFLSVGRSLFFRRSLALPCLCASSKVFSRSFSLSLSQAAPYDISGRESGKRAP